MKKSNPIFLLTIMLLWWPCLFGQQAPGVPPMVMLRGMVTDTGGSPLAATIDVYDHEKQQWVAQFATNPHTGAFYLTIPAGEHYGVIIWQQDHLFHSENINATQSNTYREEERNITLQPVTPGERMKLSNIFFKPGRATLHPYSIPELEALHRVLKSNPRLNIQIHTGRGDRKKLSQKRARRLIRYLEKQGISRERMCCLIRPHLVDEQTSQIRQSEVDRQLFEIVLSGRQ